MQRYDACMGMDFVTTDQETPTQASAVTEKGQITISIPDNETDGKFQQKLSGTPYLAVVLKNTEPSGTASLGGQEADVVKYQVRVYYAGKTDDYMGAQLTSYIDLVPGEYVYDGQYPLIKFELSKDKKSISYTYISKANSNPVTLVKGQKKYSGPTQIDDRSVIFDNWMKAYYNNDQISLYDYSEKFSPFCTMPWNSYSDWLAGNCQQSKLFFIKTVNQETIKNQEGISDRATVQVQVDINKANDCCSDCTTCNTLQDTGLDCASCDNCEITNVVDQDVCQPKDSAEQSSVSSTNTPQSCCSDCSTCSEAACNQCQSCIYLDSKCVYSNVPAVT
jgi:hypothetical protein